MERIAILGANSLIGQHLINAIDFFNVKSINVWEENEKFVYRINDNNNYDLSKINTFVGFEWLEGVIDGSDIVFNLYESQDFSLVPNKKLIQKNNVDFVHLILQKCKAVNVKKLVHLSSIFIQSSARWPNVYSREELDYSKFKSNVPFPVYCNSKYEAEKIIWNAADDIQSICARVGLIYGEGDEKSLICDAICFSKLIKVLPRIGDSNGTIQMTYAGNVAFALLMCAQKLFNDETIKSEVVLIHDNTPNKNIYDVVLKSLCSNKIENKDENDEDENLLTKKKINKLIISNHFISFYVFYPIYFFLCLIALFWTKFVNEKALIGKLPSQNYAFMVFHNWTFYSDFKLRIFFKYKPKFDFETSLKRSIEYYKNLDCNNIKSFSWIS